MIYKKNNYNYNKQKTNNFIIFQIAIYLLSNNLITRLKEKVTFQQFHEQPTVIRCRVLSITVQQAILQVF